ncbi:MAG: hypothetical protein L0H15_08650 [Nitrosospira sp.]|nr:hypothetical protein [Nitrosospira sp.]
MKKQNHDDAFTPFSALLDKGAEVFTNKMFKHSQSKAQERWRDMEPGQRGKRSFVKSRFRSDEFDLG